MNYIIILLFISPFCVAFHDPYKVLGIPHSASSSQIKKAYKNLAKEWHPDKNQEPHAENRFIEINQAYELLSDPNRKSLFDNLGVTEGDAKSYRQQNHFHSFDGFFGNGGHVRYEFRFDQGSTFHKQSITSSTFDGVIIPASSRHPYLLLFYSDWCLTCFQAEVIWKKIVDEMEPIGLKTATVHVDLEHVLAKRIGVSMLPFLTLVLDGQVYQYKEHQLSLIRASDFVKSKLPYAIVTRVNMYTVKDFLLGWTDNRVRILIFSKQESIRLRYLLVAYEFKMHAVFGYVQLGMPDTDSVANLHHVNPQMETLLIFNEYSNVPVASLSMPDIPSDTMRGVVSANRFLLLPRLSSQDMFDQLCPPEASRFRKRLCVVLVTKSVSSHEPYRQAVRAFLHGNPLENNNRVRFVYIFSDKQVDFVKALSASSIVTSEVGLVVVWRKNNITLQYQWLSEDWFVDTDKVNVSGQFIYSTIADLLQSNDPISADAVVKTLVDEHTLSIISRMILKLVTVTQYLKENLTRDDTLPAVSVLLTIAFVLIGSYFMSYLVKLEEETIAEKYRKEGKVPPGVVRKEAKDVTLSVHELRGETYNGLIRLLKPGCRTILLLVDSESKDKLLPVFHKACYPYRKNKSLLFAFLMLEKNLDWYRNLLIQTLAEPRDLNINMKNCIGTVLSLNGHRKYFCMYHAKYRENVRGASGSGRRRDGGGEFIGFDDTSNSSESECSDVESGQNAKKQPLLEPKVLSLDNLLDGLPNWLDRLFEGSTQRYYIKFWPRMK